MHGHGLFKTENTYVFINFISENLAVCNKMWENTVEPRRAIDGN
jgi:hypothetical protein